jgi:hypothetical protein
VTVVVPAVIVNVELNVKLIAENVPDSVNVPG